MENNKDNEGSTDGMKNNGEANDYKGKNGIKKTEGALPERKNGFRKWESFEHLSAKPEAYVSDRFRLHR